MNKSDPMYYKVKIEQLIKQAMESGLEISLSNNGFSLRLILNQTMENAVERC